MRIHIFGMPYNEEQRLLITPFIEAVEEMALQYKFACSLDMRCTYFSQDLRLVFNFRWTPDVQTYSFEASVTLKDIEAMGAKGTDDFDAFVYHFARLMISSLALSLKTKAVDQSTWQGEHTPTTDPRPGGRVPGSTDAIGFGRMFKDAGLI